MVVSWTDNDMSGNPMDWTDPRPWEASFIEAIIRAYNERAITASRTFPTAGITPISAAYVDNKKKLTTADLITIHDAIVALVPHYIDHVYNDGDFSGETIIPAWTWDKILSASGITDASYPNSKVHAKSDLIKQWAIQCYKVLNLLRWNRMDMIYKSDRYYRQGQGVNADYATALASAQSAYNAASWTAHTNASNSSCYGAYTYDYSNRYVISLFNAVCKYGADIPVYGFGTIDVDEYLPAMIVNKHTPPTFYTVFYSEEGFLQNFSLMGSGTAIEGERYTTEEHGDRDIYPPSPDDHGLCVSSNGSKFWAGKDAALILKFTGFAFRDW